MAKECVKARQVKRERIVEQYAERRAELKKNHDYAGLAKLPRNASPVRLRNRCQITGRPRGYIRQFGICRNMFREWALMGKIPGVTKASW